MALEADLPPTAVTPWEQSKKPSVPKGTAVFLWLRIVDDVRTIFMGQQEYIYVPDLRREAIGI